MKKKDKMNKLYLVAVSGDLSAKGMGDVAEVIPVFEKHKQILKDFLMAQCEIRIEQEYWKPKTEFHLLYWDNYYKCVDKLWDAKIFDNKYHSRTTWKLMNQYSLKELDYKYKIKDVETGDWFDDHVIIMGLSDNDKGQLKEKLKQEIIK